MNSSENRNLLPFNWKAVVIGLVISLILGAIISFLSANLNLSIGFIPLVVGSIIAGYLAKGHPMNGAIHGGLVGVGIWLVYIVLIFYQYQNVFLQILQSLAISLIANICIGIIGGIVGSLIVIVEMKLKKNQ